MSLDSAVVMLMSSPMLRPSSTQCSVDIYVGEPTFASRFDEPTSVARQHSIVHLKTKTGPRGGGEKEDKTQGYYF